MNVTSVLDLSNKERGHVCPGDDPISPLAGLCKDLVAARPWPAGENAGPHDRPVEPAFLDQTLLQALVVISAAEDDLEWQPLQPADARAAIASSKASHTYRTFDTPRLHRRDQHPDRV